MEEIKLVGVDEIIYKETLDNGLTVFLFKKPGFQKKYAFFETKYGSNHNEFIPEGSNEFKNMPYGIAHFLEHKLFESNDDSNVFTKFENNGSYVNAATSYDKTYYYFYTVDNFEDSLITLLDFVQSPYFTDDNVSKEKGIIEQEIDMRNDQPDGFLYQKLIQNVLKKSPYRFDIAGTKESINKITKEDLYECYNTFYHPSNMFLVVAGDIDVEDTIKIIKENQKNKHYNPQKEIKVKTYLEPKEVSKKEDIYKHNVNDLKLGYCYKMNFPKLKPEERYLFGLYVDMYLRILFGDTSDFSDNLIKQKIVKSYFMYDLEFLKNENYNLLIYFVCDVLNKEKLEELLNKKLQEKDGFEKMFELLKKNYLSSYILRFESIDSVVSLVRNSYNSYGKIIDNMYDLITSLNYEDFKKVINSLNYDNYCEVILEPSKED